LAETGSLQPSLEIQVGDWLRHHGWKLITAESCTGGLISHLMTNVPGSSDYFLGGLVSYAYEAKQNWLGVSPDTLARCGAVSEDVVLEMARGARQSLSALFPIDQLVGLSVSGVAGPGGGSPDKPVGLVWIGLSAPGFEGAWQFTWQGTRVENKERSAEQALRILLDFLQRERS
jgi:PncC family amidohydrolase